MNDKIKLLHQERHWTEEVNLLLEIYEGLGQPSVRQLAEMVNKSKSWVDKSLQLARGLRVHHHLKDEETRHAAYRFIQSRKKHNRYLK